MRVVKGNVNTKGGEKMSDWQEYNRLKQEWLEEHPEATAQEIEEFCKKLAEELNL